MSKSNEDVAVAYYTAMGEKDLAGMEMYLHPAVQFIGPLAQTMGKEDFLRAMKGFIAFFKTLTIRARFGSENQAMLAYDLDFPAPIGSVPTAVLLTFNDGLIAKVEVFFDSCRIAKK